jgi:hypothetical protein
MWLSLKTMLNDRWRMEGSGARMMIAFEGDGRAGAKRAWVATMATAIKASAAASSTLAEHEKMTLAKGTHVTATITGEDQSYWTISGGLSGDAPIPEELRFIYKGHWALQPEVATETPAVQEMKPATTVHDAPEPLTASESIALSPQPEPPAMRPVINPKMEPTPAKPVNHRRLFALFKRDVKKKR